LVFEKNKFCESLFPLICADFKAADFR
jgi:hypothetical protein